MGAVLLFSVLLSLCYINHEAEKEARRNRRFRHIPLENREFVQNDFSRAA